MAYNSAPYSDLEVFHREQYDHGKQLTPEHEKIVGSASKTDGIEVAAKGVPFYHSADTNGNYVDSSLMELAGSEEKKKLGFLASHSKRRKWMIFGGIALAVVILAAALGGGLAATKHSSTKSVPLSTATEASASASPRTSTSASASQTAGPLPTHGLAAVSYPSGSSNKTHLYYQDSTGELIESISSSDNGSWTSKSLGVKANSGSSIAAAVTKPGLDPVSISLFYIDPSHKLQNLIFSSDTSAWTAGNLSAQNIAVYPSSSLTALANPCPSCTYTTILVYQDTQGFINIANQTDLNAAWETSELTGQPLGVNFALQNNTDPGTAGHWVNFWYQQSNGDLAYLFWNPDAGWSSLTTIPQYQTFSKNTFLAASVSKQVADSGSQLWINLLSLAAQGIRVDTWSGNLKDWLVTGGNPGAMANSSTSDGGEKGLQFGALTATAAGDVFAFTREEEEEKVKVKGWKMDGDLQTWRERVGVDMS
ncbi:hypothetical protein ACMFMG_010262 [Clarireedia jacksonii]